MVDEAALARAERGSVVAPAGCGKTELIARAVGAHVKGRALVLTHTHAGVKALRDRLRRLRVDRDRVHVETIAGWCLRYARAYPSGAGLVSPEPTTGTEWNGVYSGTLELVNGAGAIRSVIAASYSCVFVDEYQDCTELQHRLVSAVADIIPCRVLGDPLQGIFGFAGGTLSWSKDVETTFPALGELTTPWRWKGKNELLGGWLLELRRKLIAGECVDLASGPVRWSASTSGNQRSQAYGLLKASGQVVAIRKWPNDAHDFARNLGGSYPSMEELDCKDLLTFAGDIDRLGGTQRAARVVEFASDCMTEVSSELETIRNALDGGRLPDLNRLRKHRAVAEALIAVTAGEEALIVLTAMRRIQEVPGAKLFRPELWREASRTLVEFERGNHKTRHKAAWAIRNQMRANGRSFGARLVSRTLLIKGLEFDHALLLNADEFEDSKRPGDGAKHFYVAATRGSQSLTVLSSQSSVQFKAPSL
jgi:DNA helicase-2/ATP-dependent DNA helicase PcrA